MSTNKYRAKIHWSDFKSDNKPSSGVYTTVARFREHYEEWPSQAWSLIIQFDCRKCCGDEWEGTVEFLSSEAPEDYLKIGACFELMEGRKVAAVGEVIA